MIEIVCPNCEKDFTEVFEENFESADDKDHKIIKRQVGMCILIILIYTWKS